MSKLFEDSGSDDDHNISLETQNEYAKQYNTWREKEELYKRKLLLKSINFEPYFKITWQNLLYSCLYLTLTPVEQKYGSGEDETDSEDDSDEPPEISEEMETQFLKTLALLKKKDPRIYDSKYSFFNKVEEENVKEDAKKGK